MNMSEPAQFIAEGLRGEMLRDEPMSRHTSWRAGGSAERLYRPADLADLQLFLRQLPADEPLLAVGLGSNLLVRDGGVRGTVVLMHGALSELRMDGGLLYAQAGVAGAKLARFAASNNFCGAEFFAGIPGTLGGMLAMNAGCYGSETWQKVQRVQVLTRSGELLERTPQDYEIGYRHVKRNQESGIRIRADARRAEGATESCIQNPESSDFENQDSGIRIRAGVRRAEGGTESCIPNPESCIQNPQSSEEFFAAAWLQFEHGDVEAARREIKALMEKRGASQPLQMPNAGSVFRNPPGEHAAKLIDGCGLKGRRIGGAQVSEKHANFIVNSGDATAADIENLINAVQATVLQQTGVDLHPEVRIVGEKNI